MKKQILFWAKEIFSALFSLATLPIGAILHLCYGFPKSYRCVYMSRRINVCLFRGCGKWWLPMIDVTILNRIDWGAVFIAVAMMYFLAHLFARIFVY